MTIEEKRQYIADCCDGFKSLLLAKADRIPPPGDCATIQQWTMDTGARCVDHQDDFGAEASVPNGEAGKTAR